MASLQGPEPAGMNILSAYREFISSPAQLAQCRQATSVEQLLQQLKLLWRQEALTDDQLVGELALCNQQLHDVDVATLSGHWLPYCYQAKSRSIRWCLPSGHATEPFHDQYIERCRGQLLNQLITPKTSITPLTTGQVTSAPLQPAGFIFHLSRCGSTLVSGCLAELDSTCVLSESPLLTELLLDDSLDEKTKQHLLPQFIHLQSVTSPGRHNIIIKWNAWDIFFWPLIRSLYPQVPVLFLVRNPVEILASHQRSAGRHMAGDRSMARLTPFFFDDRCAKSILDNRIDVLDQLINGMLTMKNEVSVVDYVELNAQKIIEIAQIFDATVTVGERERIEQRMTVHSKDPHCFFTDDTHQKRQFFSAAEKEKINYRLLNAYQALTGKLKQQDLDYAL